MLYVERGGRTLLTWTDDAERLGPAAGSLAEADPAGRAGPAHRRERVDGEPLLGSGRTPLREALQDAGFVATPRGLRLRADGVPEGDTVYRAARGSTARSPGSC